MNKIFTTIMRNKPGLLLIFLILSFSCSDFLEEDISDQELTLKSPAWGYKSEISTINFLWHEVENTVEYHLQVVTPSFDSIQSVVLDTFINKNSFTYNFIPGNYEWGVEASNYSSSTYMFYSSFIIDTSSILTGTEILLITPEPNSYLSKNSINFKWEKNDLADKYNFSIYKDSEEGELIYEKTMTYDTISLSLNEGTYFWSIQAFNKISASLLSSRKIVIDRTNPGVPLLFLPEDKDTLYTDEDNNLSWRRPDVSLAPIRDSVIISSDSLFRKTSIKEIVYKDSTIHLLNMNDPGTYFWRVRSFDLAGNKSGYSKVRKFLIIKK